MNRLIFIMFFGLATFLTINAQSNPGLGIKGGLNYSIRFNFLSEDQSLMAFHGGVNIYYPISNHLTLQSEIILSQKGEKWFEEIMKGKYRLTYIDVPLLLLFHPTPNNPFFNIQAGPQIGYLIRAKDIVENELENVKGKRDIKERYKDFDIGLAIGFEFNFPFHMNLTLRYIHGLSVVSDFYGKEIKNYVLQVSAGYRLIGK